MMLARQRGDFGLNAKQFGNERIQMRRQRKNQFRFGFNRQCCRIAACCGYTRDERGIYVIQIREECRIQPRERAGIVKIGEGKAKTQCQGRRITNRIFHVVSLCVAAWSACRPAPRNRRYG